MINSLRLKNFQSHKDTTLEFTKGLNTIRGVSDSGKSAVLRGLYLLINNKPAGDDYCSNWGGTTSVSAEFDEFSLSNSRISNSNEYKLDESVFKALNGKVPSEVEAQVNMSAINMQRQLDAPFLLSETSGEIAKILNTTVNLDIIDRTNKNINSMHRAVNAELKFHTEKAEELQIRMKKYKTIGSLEKDVEALQLIHEKKEETLEEIQSTRRKITTLKDLEVHIVQKAQAITTMSSLYIKGEAAVELYNKKESISTELSDLVFKKSYFVNTEESLTRLSNKLMKAQRLYTLGSKAAEEREKITLQGQELQTLKKKLDKSKDLWYKIDKLDEQLKQDKEEYTRLMPEVCPLCEK